MAARLVCSTDRKNVIFYSLVETNVPEIEGTKVNQFLTVKVLLESLLLV
jgi:hypothetical protein